jgi:phosphatidate cytidylyltransferase
VTGLPARILSGLVLAPLFLAAVHYGSPYIEVVVVCGGAVLAWEWARLCGRRRLGVPGAVTIAAVLAAVGASALRNYSVAGWLVAAGAMAAAVAGLARTQDRASWYALGVVYISLACLALLWLRQQPEIGRTVVYWLVGLVWATDIGAFVVGRAVGGPRLTPRISPNKTWAGLGGGALCAALVGAAVGFLVDSADPVALAILSLALAIVSQAGDLFESSLKRRVGVKDASGLIPGHGGLLDRVDGLMAASLAVAFVVWFGRVPI